MRWSVRRMGESIGSVYRIDLRGPQPKARRRPAQRRTPCVSSASSKKRKRGRESGTHHIIIIMIHHHPIMMVYGPCCLACLQGLDRPQPWTRAAIQRHTTAPNPSNPSPQSPHSQHNITVACVRPAGLGDSECPLWAIRASEPAPPHEIRGTRIWASGRRHEFYVVSINCTRAWRGRYHACGREWGLRCPWPGPE